MGLLKEFRTFALRGNVIDLAVGVIIGAAFGKIVQSLVNDVIMPPLGLAMGRVDFGDKKIILRAAVKGAEGVAAVPEVALRYGTFINVTIEFLIVAAAVFMLVKAVNTARRRFEKEPEAAPPAPTTQEKLLMEIRDLLKAGAR